MSRGVISRFDRLGKVAWKAATGERVVPRSEYAGRPVDYCREVLEVGLSPDQERILRCLHEAPCIVNVPSGNNTGKTFVGACAVSYWYDCFSPAAVYSIAPRYEHVVSVLWAQLRLLRGRRNLGGFAGPRVPEMRDGPDHFAVGITADKAESFRGRHLGRKLWVFDEATGLGHSYFDELPTMFDPHSGDAALFLYNPTDTTSRMYLEDQRCLLGDADDGQAWHRIRLSALDHPNIAADLAGLPLPYPGAVNARMIDQWVKDGCELVADRDADATCIQWRGQWYKPGPWFQARGLGIWPDSGSGVWSDSLWAAAMKSQAVPEDDTLPEIGCDCSQGKGDDWYAWHGRWGNVSLRHETANTMDAARIFARLKEAAEEMAAYMTARRPPQAKAIEGRQIRIKIDDDGTGNAVSAFLRKDGYKAVGVGAGTKALLEKKYPNKRSELWFQVAELARYGRVCVSRLDRPTLRRLKQQLMAQEWDLDGAQRRVCCPKDEVKEKIGRSPDDADAFNLAYYSVAASAVKAYPAKERLDKGGHFSKRV